MISQVELDRNQKRLGILKKVRPAFMDEYEELEAELKKCYEDYMIRSVSSDGHGVLIFINNLTRFPGGCNIWLRLQTKCCTFVLCCQNLKNNIAN